MEKDIKVFLETWKHLMTIKIEKNYPSIDAVIKDLLKIRKPKRKLNKKLNYRG